MTEGFHPGPRLIVAQSLPLGIVGHSEVVELELTSEVEPEEVLRRLREQSPPGIDFLSARRIAIKTTARPRRAVYRIDFGGTDFTSDLPSRIQAFLHAAEIWAERERPRPRAINIRPYVESIDSTGDGLIIRVWLTQEGTARADEIARALGLNNPVSIERLDLELMDEVPPDVAAATPKIAPQTRPLNKSVSIDAMPVAPRETWGATANGPIVE
jgi:radical SAM-linked protein